MKLKKTVKVTKKVLCTKLKFVNVACMKMLWCTCLLRLGCLHDCEKSEILTNTPCIIVTD